MHVIELHSLYLCIAYENLTEEQKLERHEKELGTIIDPFLAPYPWVKKTKVNGDVVYVNQETNAVKSKHPGEVNKVIFVNVIDLTAIFTSGMGRQVLQVREPNSSRRL